MFKTLCFEELFFIEKKRNVCYNEKNRASEGIMNYWEVKITTTTEGIEHVIGVLLMLGITEVVTEDRHDYEWLVSQVRPHWDYVDESLKRLETVESSVTFYLPEDTQGKEMLAAVRSEIKRLADADKSHQFGKLCSEVKSLSQEDWENGWKKYFKPFTVGERLLVQPSWYDTPEDCSRAILTIDPGMSFGTGQHHTTRLCMLALEKAVRPSDRVLDLGCGSGILSIAALLLGAERATAVDIDETAVRISRENAALNGFGPDRFIAHCGDILTDKTLRQNIAGKYDVVVANIVADVLIAFAPIFKEYMAPQGRVICSGIIDHRLTDVKTALTAAGYQIEEQNQLESWFELELSLGGCKNE